MSDTQSKHTPGPMKAFVVSYETHGEEHWDGERLIGYDNVRKGLMVFHAASADEAVDHLDPSDYSTVKVLGELPMPYAAAPDLLAFVEARFLELGRQGGNMTGPHLTNSVRTEWEACRALLKQAGAL